MKKTEIRVTIDSVEKQQRAIEILGRYKQPIRKNPIDLMFDDDFKNLYLSKSIHSWFIGCNTKQRTEITLDELEELLKAEK